MANRAPLALLCLLLCAACGCTVPVHYERGELLTTEQRVLGRRAEYEVRALEQLEAHPPCLLVWVDSRDRIRREERDIFRKVEVSGTRRPSFEPAFLLWPLNVARTPVGLFGAAFSSVDWFSHYLAAGVGTVVGFVSTGFSGTYFRAGAQLGLVEINDRTGLGTVGALTQTAIAILETPLLVVDVPHMIVHGTPIYPVLRNRQEFPERWAQAVAASWDFAWAWKNYPPFILWYRVDESRSPVPGSTMHSAWKRADRFGEWRHAFVRGLRIQTEAVDRIVPTHGGPVRIDLAALARETDAKRELRLTVSTQTPGGEASRDFIFPVRELLVPSRSQ